MRLAIADPPYLGRAQRWYSAGGCANGYGVGLADDHNDVLSCGIQNRAGFAGHKPERWTRWVLDALGYEAETDTVDDLFPGSGAVSQVIAQGVLV